MKDRYLLLKGCAGLGNRFITLMKALQYSRLSGRKIYVDWSDGMFDAAGNNIFYEFFELNYENKVTIEQIKEVYNNGGTTYPRYIYLEDFEKPIYPESNVESSFKVYSPAISKKTIYKVVLSLIPLHKIVYLLGLQSFQRPDKFKDLTWWKVVKTINDGNNLPLGSNLWPWLKADIVFFADFRPFCSMKKFSSTIKLKEEYETIINNMASFLKLHNAIGVHIRYTDKKPKKQLDNLIGKLQKEVDNESKIFLCTDNKDIEEDFVRIFGDKIIKTDKYIPKVKGEGIHIWASLQNDNSLKRQMFEDSLIDMWLLSKCKFLYWQGNSSFSLISKLLIDDNKKCKDWLRL